MLASDNHLKPIVNYVVYKQSSLTIKGYVEAKRIQYNKKMTILMKKRNSSYRYVIPLTWIGTNQWEAMIDFNLYKPSKGTWDYYFKLDSGETFRIKMEENIELPSEVLFYEGNDGCSQLEVYKTIKDSFSTKSKMSSIATESLQAKTYDKWSVILEGILKSSLLSKYYGFHQPSVVLIQRNTKTTYEIPINITPTEYENTYAFTFDIDYRNIIPFNHLNKRRWDVYLQLDGDGSRHLFRFHLHRGTEDRIQYDSRIQFENPSVYQIYFYPTINNNLSINLNQPQIVRDLQICAIENDVLHLRGYAFIDTNKFDQQETLQRRLMIKSRESEQEVTFALNSLNPVNQSDYHYAGFDIKIRLSDILQLQTSQKDIFDLYIQIEYHGEVKQRKLGFNEYNYKKDGVLTKTTLKYKGFYFKNYVTLTPRGNAKIETVALTKIAYFYLKYGQKIDRLLNRKKDVWLIGERPDTAQDTGYHFFKYCRETFPEKDIYYVINPDAKDIKNIEKLGNVIFSGSLKHFRIASIANAFITSHDADYILPIKGEELTNFTNGKRVFLQHGVLGRKNVEYHKKYYNYPFNLFCVSSEAEKKMVMRKMKYTDKNVKITGLSRFDKLLEPRREKNYILLIPTWREWLNDQDKFLQSEYFQRYRSLLKNENLLTFLDQNNLYLNFYPHYRMQPYIDEFKKLQSKHVNIIELGEKNVQDLLIESKLMITDYSSVSFDFNYMSKPIVFYHFDVDTFFKNGILRPIEETFLGDICKDEEQIVRSIQYYFANDFNERPEITEKKDLIFSRIDRSNCRRIFECITKL